LNPLRKTALLPAAIEDYVAADAPVRVDRRITTAERRFVSFHLHEDAMERMTARHDPKSQRGMRRASYNDPESMVCQPKAEQFRSTST
jgi:hypothetical protein